jgi:multiple sugar transport system permease protein
MSYLTRPSQWWKNMIFLVGTIILISAFLMPLIYGITTSLKSEIQISTANAPLLPSSSDTIDIDGTVYPVVRVPQEDGSYKEMVLFKKGRQSSQLLELDDLNGTPIEWQGNW